MPSRRGFDLCSVLRQAASLREEMVRQAKVHLTVSCEPDTCPVLGSPEEAELMVFHLLSNALRASAPGGKIVLRLCRAEDAWRLTVTDHGCGLPGPANWQENRRRFLGGAGAGLKICRAVCRRAGWGFALEAGSGGGAEAVVTLPMEPETAASGDTIALHAAGGGAALPAALAAGTGAASAGWECLESGIFRMLENLLQQNQQFFARQTVNVVLGNLCKTSCKKMVP